MKKLAKKDEKTGYNYLQFHNVKYSYKFKWVSKVLKIFTNISLMECTATWSNNCKHLQIP